MSRAMLRRPVLASFALLPALAATVRAQGSVGRAETKRFNARNFRPQSGAVLPEIAIAYVTYGKLAPDGRNAVLLTHGFTASHHMAGRGRRGRADDLVGPGKAIDTDRLYVVSSNMLGSSFGSTGPAHKNPVTGRPYGPDFPDITEGIARQSGRQALGRGRRSVVRGPSGVSMGRHLFRLHGRAGAGGHRTQGIGR